MQTNPNKHVETQEIEPNFSSRHSFLSYGSRRSFLGRISLFTAATFVSGTIGTNISRNKTGEIAQAANVAAEPEMLQLRSKLFDYSKLREKAYQIRITAAKDNREVPIPPHPTNGDEELYPNKIATDTRGLQHNQQGEVQLESYNSLIKALSSHNHEDFEKIILGGSRKLVNPEGPLAISLEGCNSVQVASPPPATLASQEQAAEAVELYWQALLRDIPFHKLQNDTNEPLVLAAVEELNKLSGFTGPKENGRVTPQTLFRGSVTYVNQNDKSGKTAQHIIPPGILVGPHISQFAWLNIPYGTQYIPPIIRTALPGNDFLTDYAEWLNIQNGGTAKSLKFDPIRRYLFTIRDLSEFSHTPGASFLGASLILDGKHNVHDPLSSGIGAPFNPGNPLVKSKTQVGGNGTFALGHLHALLHLSTSRAVRAAYWQKYYVHRRLRPEAYGGLVHHNLVNKTEYPIHQDILNSQALAQSFSKFGSYLLPHGYPEGAPLHSSYVGGAAAIAGANTTILKAYFDENFVIPNPVVPDPKDPTKVIPYRGEPLTVGGELNKLATNYALGRGHGGIHWRTDGATGLALGEAIAISILKDEGLGYNESYKGFTFTKFDGTKITV